METTTNEVRTCPKCGKPYTARPAISRVDGQTPICPLCGTREALESMNVPSEEIEKIVATIVSYEAKYGIAD